jgi:hypothetical protein
MFPVDALRVRLRSPAGLRRATGPGDTSRRTGNACHPPRAPFHLSTRRGHLFTRHRHLFTRYRRQNRDKPDRKCRRRVKSRDHGRPARPRPTEHARRRLLDNYPNCHIQGITGRRGPPRSGAARAGGTGGRGGAWRAGRRGPLHHLDCPCTLYRTLLPNSGPGGQLRPPGRSLRHRSPLNPAGPRSFAARGPPPEGARGPRAPSAESGSKVFPWGKMGQKPQLLASKGARDI